MVRTMKAQATNKYDVIVVGGGAAGLMAAAHAAERGRKVLILEKNRRVGEKLVITGGGRCNITNATYDAHALLAKYGESAQALYSPYSQFGVEGTFSFFEKLGLPIEVEANNRAFPKSRKAADVRKVLASYLDEKGVKVAVGIAVTKVETEGNRITTVTAGGEKFSADTFVFATGGVSHPETGSTGDGFHWLKKLGHSIVTPTPGIVPIRTLESWIKKLAGKALPNAKITFFVEGAKKFSKTGRILCTHFGLSGPLILNSAEEIGDLLHIGTVTATIDLFPTEDQGILERRLLSVFDQNKNKNLRTVLKDLVPSGTNDTLLELLAGTLDGEKKVHSITVAERKALARTLKTLPVTVTGLMGFDRAVVADGGVPLAEIDTRTMRSRIMANLYIIGDLLDISRPSGGYSLQLCWTTGYVAGENA